VLLQESKEHVSIEYTCNTYFVMHWCPCHLFRSFRSMFSYNTNISVSITTTELSMKMWSI